MGLVYKTKETIDVQGTLLTIPEGETVEIPVKKIKPNSIRVAIRALNNKGYSFTQTEAGLVDSVKVTRYKSK